MMMVGQGLLFSCIMKLYFNNFSLSKIQKHIWSISLMNIRLYEIVSIGLSDQHTIINPNTLYASLSSKFASPQLPYSYPEHFPFSIFDTIHFNFIKLYICDSK